MLCPFGCGSVRGSAGSLVDRQNPVASRTGKRLSVVVMHDDAEREYAYGPAQGLPDTKVGAWSQEMYDMAKQQNWTIIRMKNDLEADFRFWVSRLSPA